MLNCHQATQLMSRAQDEKLTLAKRGQLRMHLLMCSACNQFSRQVKSLRHISRAYARPEGDSPSDQNREEGR
ncbi:MAG: zf-HC2 domain-containing protein [Pseudomonadota bacterium]